MHSRISKKVLPPVVIWGASGHAQVIADIVRMERKFEIVGFLDDITPNSKGKSFCGSVILGGQEQFTTLLNDGVRHMFLGVGNCQARLRLASIIKKKFELITAVHPKAIIANDSVVGVGTAIMAGSIINPGCQIGENVIVNTASSIDHGCYIGDGVHISPGVSIGGDVTINSGAWIGIGAVIKDKVCVGKNSIVGAGSVVIEDVADDVLVFGLPAKKIKNIPK